MKRIRRNNLNKQLKEHSKPVKRKRKPYEGDDSYMISTGSTLLDLAISGGRKRGGGIPVGILVEVFGPESAGKTVLLCEIAGNVQRNGGGIMFGDPEARLNKEFAKLFGLKIKKEDYSTPDTVTEVFRAVRAWKPDLTKINGIFTDSLAALSTDLEMGSEEGDKMGQRRAKELSQELRRTCRILQGNKYLMVASNQVRESESISFGGKTIRRWDSPGGWAVRFYSSLRLRASKPEKLENKITYKGKVIKEAIGVRTEFEVFKSTVWKPYKKAPVTIIFDYGIDDIRENLQYLKDYTKSTIYSIGDRKLKQGMEDSIKMVEREGLEEELKEAVIDLWETIQEKFESDRKPKVR